MRYMLMTALLLAACGDARRPPGTDTLSDRLPPGADDTSDGAPCGLSDDECWDSVNTTGQVRSLMAAPRAPTALSLAAAAQSYKPDTSLYRVQYRISRDLNAGETLYVRLRRDTVGGNTARNILVKRRTRRDSVDFRVDKVFGKAARYSSVLQYKRNQGDVVGLRTVSWTTNFPTPVDTTPPGVDTLIVDSAMALLLKPDAPAITRQDWEAKGIFYQDTTNGDLYDSLNRKLSFKCPAGGTRCPGIQFCTFVVFGDSNIALRAADRDKQECQFEYGKFPERVRDVRAVQQQKADRMCIKYSAEGGTITSEPCGVES